jgi:hypothetical protein
VYTKDNFLGCDRAAYFPDYADPWICGTRVGDHMTPAADHGCSLDQAGFGITCECPLQLDSHTKNQSQMWGYAYGGDAVIVGSAGFSGCTAPRVPPT